MNILVDFMVSFAASVIANYVSKWFERHHKGQ